MDVRFFCKDGGKYPRNVDYVPDEMQAKKRPTAAEKLHIAIARFRRQLASATAKLRASQMREKRLKAKLT